MYRLVTQAQLRLKKGGEAFVFANTVSMIRQLGPRQYVIDRECAPHIAS